MEAWSISNQGGTPGEEWIDVYLESSLKDKGQKQADAIEERAHERYVVTGL